MKTKRIIATTKTDASGKFVFKNIRKQKGQRLELGISNGASLRGGPFHYCKLPMDPAPPLELMEECDDSAIFRVGVAFCVCNHDPCPCASFPIPKNF